ncbi:unnamed protein product [Acanthoscelides obtectus]|uniref:glutamate dehydrogenase [NAD(P)(+)] n=1 Tax=Acanthoscelides obtectus TaxID=200917 RepID=A0A9P0LVQ3_ACAOB|nr:unnamed protein product [Acanthoscelides obtectus]CAK1669167.1 Glutamate dehydrogenase, mitochondrial [Acanthoscelides obtectus]
MAFIINSKVVTPTKIVKPPPKGLVYEIPERYKNSFYLANASLFDSTNWFLHRTFEIFFPTLKKEIKKYERYKSLNNENLHAKTENLVQVLDQCNSIIDVRYPIKRDNGEYRIIRGFRVNYGQETGYKSCLGGIRLGPDITRDHMKGLSVLSAYRNASLGINMSGAHGGIKVDPKTYSDNELKSILEGYTIQLMNKGYCCERDIVYPDMSCSVKEMDWIARTIAKCRGDASIVTATGKSQELGGFEHYVKMLSQASFAALNFVLNNQQMMDKVGLKTGLKDKTFILQGLGKLGAPLAKMLSENGAICVGIKDTDAFIYDAKGIDFQKLYEHKMKMGTLKNFGCAKEDTKNDVYTEPCDILIFAAKQRSLSCYIAENVKAKVVLEAAEAPMTPTAHQILTGKGKIVIPDLYACSGGTVCSYLEFLKGLQQSGRLSEDALRYSGDIYQSILKNMSGKEILEAGGVTRHLETHVDEKTLIDSLDCILTDVGNDIVKLNEVNKLGTDLRTPAYMLGYCSENPSTVAPFTNVAFRLQCDPGFSTVIL